MTMLIEATFEFVESDYRIIADFVTIQLGIEDLKSHFHSNREWRRERVRMLTPSAPDHSKRILTILEFIQGNGNLKMCVTEDLVKYFRSFARRAEEGFYAELSDVSLFLEVGVDRHGLTLWARLRGSVRCENLHQKMDKIIN